MLSRFHKKKKNVIIIFHNSLFLNTVYSSWPDESRLPHGEIMTWSNNLQCCSHIMDTSCMTIQGRVTAPNNLLLCNSGAGTQSLSGAQVWWRKAASCTPKCMWHIHAERCIHLINWRHPFISPTDPSLTAHPNRQLCYSDIGSLKINTTDPADVSPVLMTTRLGWSVLANHQTGAATAKPCAEQSVDANERGLKIVKYFSKGKKNKKKWEHFVT